MSDLRSSQIETLKRVDNRERTEVVGMKPFDLAAITGDSERVARERLTELFDRGLLYRQLEPTEYGLTQQGREALGQNTSGGDEER